MKITRIVCDVCGKDRNERNHWFFVVMDGTTLRINPYRDQEVTIPEYEWHICGLDCLKEKLRTYVESFHHPIPVVDDDDIPF